MTRSRIVLHGAMNIHLGWLWRVSGLGGVEIRFDKGRAMIIRVWRGRTSVEKADEYQRFLKDMAFPDYGGVRGNRGWILLRRPASDAVEFMFVSFWDSMEALVEYTGGDPQRPKYYPEDRAALLELPQEVEHYDVVDLQARW